MTGKTEKQRAEGRRGNKEERRAKQTAALLQTSSLYYMFSGLIINDLTCGFFEGMELLLVGFGCLFLHPDFRWLVK